MGTLQRQTTLSKQTSAVFNLTLDQLQQSVGSGKPFGSMNMEDFLATVWDREGGGVPVPAEAPYNGPEAVPAFQNQNSVGLHPDYSGKTVEEVWNAIHASSSAQPQDPSGYQQVTLGNFLQSVGVDVPSLPSSLPSLPCQDSFMGLLPPAPELQLQVRSLYHPQPDGAVHITQGQHNGGHKKDGDLPYGQHHQHQHPLLDPAPPLALQQRAPQHANQMGAHPAPPRQPRTAGRRAVRTSVFEDPDEGGRAPHVVEGRPWPLQRPASPTVSMPHTPQHSPNSQGPLGNAHAAKASIADPMQTDPPHQPSTSAPLPSQGKRSRESFAAMPQLPERDQPPTLAPGPAPAGKASPGQATRAARQRKRKPDPEVVDERTQRLQKRMVKNRESAARSRARKQEYTASLEAQVEELKAANRELLERVIAHCPPPPAAHVPTLNGEPLRRTRTTPL